MSKSDMHRMACLFGAVAAVGCLTASEEPQRAIEWNDVQWSGGSVSVAVVRPADEGTGPHPVVFALPWGSGTSELVESFIQSYWLTQPSMRSYYVVAPAVRGTSLEQDADELIPALFDWMETELSFDPDQVALVGASNGGRGLFFAGLSQPDRFRALVGLPGSYTGDAANLAVLDGKPIRLLVGEFDDGWVASGEATVAALASQGIDTELEIVPGEGHVMRLDPRSLMDWIDAALGR